MKQCDASHHLDTFVGSLAETDTRKVAEVVRRSRHKKQLTQNAIHFFALSPKPIAQFRWKRARLSLFRPQPRLPSFIQIHPSFRDLLAKTTFQIVTIIGDLIGYRIADNNTGLHSV